jgi:hypothetical protein
MAFGVFNQDTSEPLDDPGFVKWTVSLDHYKGFQRLSRQEVKTRMCTVEDMQQFYEFSVEDDLYIKELTSKNVLRCIDPTQKVDIRGKDEVDSVVLNIDLYACDYTETKCSHKSQQ